MATSSIPFIPTLNATLYGGDMNEVPAGVVYINNNPNNAPTATGAYFVITTRYSNHAVQLAIRRDGDSIYARRMSSGNWAAWYRVV